LKGTTQANGILATKGNNNYYVLSGDTFKKFTGENFAANKAYFEVDGENNVLARGFNIVFVDEATVINEVGNTEQEAEGYYNLSGQRIAQPTNGLYIVNGKKVIIK
jgi:roadblock/LC7 domain-containing protein